MPKIDTAAAMFQRVYEAYTVQSDTPEYVENGTYHVLSPSGTQLGEGMSLDDAAVLRDQYAGRAAVIAVMREMISAEVLTDGAKYAGLRLEKVENNKINLGRRAPLALLNGVLHAIEMDTKA